MKRYYILHYFDPANVGSFLLVSLLGLILVLTLVLLIAKLQIQRQLKEETEEKCEKKYAGRNTSAGSIRLWKSFYELVFSGTSILLFLSLYYIIDERLPQISMYWEKYQDVVLLVFIVLSVFLTSWLDVVLVKLTHLEPEQKASVRLICGLLYCTDSPVHPLYLRGHELRRPDSLFPDTDGRPLPVFRLYGQEFS